MQASRETHLQNNALTTISPANAGSWELNLAEHRLFWSTEQYRIYGYEPNELKLNDEYFIINTTHPSDIERISSIIHEALRIKEGYNFKRRIIKKDGSFGFVQTEALIIRSKKGIPNKIIGTTSDVKGNVEKGICDYNDPAFFDKFYSDYKKAVTGELYKMTSDSDLSRDLCQEIFLKAWHNMAKYDPSKGTLYTWLISIAKNHCKDYLGSKYYRYQQLTRSFDLLSDQTVHNGSGDLEQPCLKELLFKLPIRQREIIDLIFMQGYTQAEVAKLKSLPVGTVKTRSRMAIGKLREFLSIPAGLALAV